MTRFHPHAEARLSERGITREEVFETVQTGEQHAVRRGRTCFRKKFTYNRKWLGRYYPTKQVDVIAVPDNDDWLVITVISRFF